MRTPQEWKPFLDGAEEVEDFYRNAQQLEERRAAIKVAQKLMYLMDRGIHEALHKNNPDPGRPLSTKTIRRRMKEFLNGGMFPYSPADIRRILTDKIVEAIHKSVPLFTVCWPDGREEEVTIIAAVKQARETGEIELLEMVIAEGVDMAVDAENLSKDRLWLSAALQELGRRAKNGEL
jgi:hypothetical protein